MIQVLDGSYGSRKFAAEKCKLATQQEGFENGLFALQAGGWCGASINAEYRYRLYGESTGCGSDGEGGELANHVYHIEHNNYTITDHGCWKDDWENDRAVPGLEGHDSLLVGEYANRNWAFELCKQAALKRGYNIFCPAK